MFELRNVLEFFFGFSTTSSTQSSTKLLNKSQIEKQLTRDCYFLFNDPILPWSMKNWCQLQTERNILSMKYHNIFIHSTTSRWYKLNVLSGIFFQFHLFLAAWSTPSRHNIFPPPHFIIKLVNWHGTTLDLLLRLWVSVWSGVPATEYDVVLLMFACNDGCLQFGLFPELTVASARAS